jgi:hypothetical protein
MSSVSNFSGFKPTRFKDCKIPAPLNGHLYVESIAYEPQRRVLSVPPSRGSNVFPSHPSQNKTIVDVNMVQQVQSIIQAFALQEAPQYTALSYTWAGEATDDQLTASSEEGSPNWTSPRNVLVNGARFHVNEPLWIALIGLERHIGQDWLWVDAICINQSDLDERTVQVNFMCRIYSSASDVVVWLGLDANLEEEVMVQCVKQLSRIMNENRHSIPRERSRP